MNQQNEQLETLQEIRSLMERNSRFMSLSGWSGVLAGITALSGTAVICYRLGINVTDPDYVRVMLTEQGAPDSGKIIFVLVISVLMLILALSGAILLARRNAGRYRLALWDNTAKNMMVNLAIPLVAGGLYSWILFTQQHLELIAPATLIFYGLALLNAGKYTINDIRYLGMFEIVVGLAASFYHEFGLLFWAFGFGVLHIIYGLVVYRKYGK